MTIQIALQVLTLVASILGIATKDWRWFGGPMAFSILSLLLFVFLGRHGG